MRKICVFTSSRADYGLLYHLMMHIKNDPQLKLQLIVTGMHNSSEFGSTYREIEIDKFKIDYKIDILLSSDNPSSVTKSMGIGLISFSDALEKLNPDILLILGDRFEILSAAIAGIIGHIPIAHLHGGESTEGAFDEAFRHSITKMSWWHFVAHDIYKKRVIQLGENKKRVYNVGGLGVDAIKKTRLLSKEALVDLISFKFKTKNILVTYHPETLNNASTEKKFNIILDVLNDHEDINFIFTFPNADTDGKIIHKMIVDFVSNHSQNSIYFKSMGRLKYLSTLKFVDCVLGNSSSGLLEAPSFKIGTINIGKRQTGRLKAESIIDCSHSNRSIKDSIKKLYSSDYQTKLKTLVNPFGDGNASEKIVDVLKNSSLPKNLIKTFYDQ
jgi:GDP/UDP-N,N'-diacetylbacillosamine 2-epimerase (hydrolysing)